MSPSGDLPLIAVRFVTFVLALSIFGMSCFEVYAPSDLRRRAGVGYRPIVPCLLALAAVAPNQRLAMVGLSGAILVALAFVGHAAGGQGLMGGLRLAIQAVHLLAAGAWLGGLPPLAGALRRGGPSVPDMLGRFGVMGAVAVPLVVITGLGTGAFMVVLAGGALGPHYVQVLAVKLTFVLSLFVLAAVNRFRLTPMMSRNPLRATAALGRTILLEQILGLGAVASVALLGQLDPTS